MAANYRNGKALSRWRFALMACFALLVAANAAMGRYGRHVRESRPETYIAIAERALNSEDYPGAFAAWEEAYARGPKSPLVHKVLGDIHHRLGHWEESIDAYEDALGVGSGSSGVRLNLMTAQLELKRYETVASLGSGFFREGFTGPLFAQYIATAYYRAENYDAAIPWFNIALGGLKNNLYLLEQLKQSYTRAGKDALAQEVQEKLDEVQRGVQGARPGPRP